MLRSYCLILHALSGYISPYEDTDHPRALAMMFEPASITWRRSEDRSRSWVADRAIREWLATRSASNADDGAELPARAPQ